MQKLQPIAITAKSENKYLVCFLTEAGEEAEYTFTIDNSAGFDLLVSEIEFLEITNGDPAADRLMRAIGNFHSARTFDYAPEDAEKSAEIRVDRFDVDASKRASA